MLLGPIAFQLFRYLIISWVSPESTGVRKTFDCCRGLARKSQKFLLVFTILLSIFCAMVEKNLLKWLLIRNGSVS